MERTPVKVLLGREASDGNLRIDALWQQASEITSVSTVCSFSYHIVTVFLLYVNAVALVALFFFWWDPFGACFLVVRGNQEKKTFTHGEHTQTSYRLIDWLGFEPANRRSCCCKGKSFNNICHHVTYDLHQTPVWAVNTPERTRTCRIRGVLACVFPFRMWSMWVCQSLCCPHPHPHPMQGQLQTSVQLLPLKVQISGVCPVTAEQFCSLHQRCLHFICCVPLCSDTPNCDVCLNSVALKNTAYVSDLRTLNKGFFFGV